MVNTREPVLTPAMIEEWKRRVNPETGKNYTQSDIARMYGVSRAWVSAIKHSTDTYSRTPRERVREMFPFETGARFHEAIPNKRLRDHAEFVETGGDGMSDEKLRRLRWFYRFLRDENIVIEFDPEIPPHEGIATGGFAYRTRQDADEDLIIRVNEHTRMDEDQKVIWALPDEDQWPNVDEG